MIPFDSLLYARSRKTNSVGKRCRRVSIERAVSRGHQPRNGRCSCVFYLAPNERVGSLGYLFCGVSLYSTTFRAYASRAIDEFTIRDARDYSTQRDRLRNVADACFRQSRLINRSDVTRVSYIYRGASERESARERDSHDSRHDPYSICDLQYARQARACARATDTLNNPRYTRVHYSRVEFVVDKFHINTYIIYVHAYEGGAPGIAL